MAIPIGNDFVKRIFSVMKNLWTDERNRLSFAQVKTELCIKFNFSMTCLQFYNHTLKIVNLSNVQNLRKNMIFSNNNSNYVKNNKQE